jgi:hypothetical protein
MTERHESGSSGYSTYELVGGFAGGATAMFFVSNCGLEGAANLCGSSPEVLWRAGVWTLGATALLMLVGMILHRLSNTGDAGLARIARRLDTVRKHAVGLWKVWNLGVSIAGVVVFARFAASFVTDASVGFQGDGSQETTIAMLSSVLVVLVAGTAAFAPYDLTAPEGRLQKIRRSLD